MTKIQTDIPRQEIHIEGITFTAADARVASDGGPSRLQHLFSEDKSGFKSSLADFLAEWFNETDTVKVHTSGSTGTPKELWVEKRRMMESARLTVNFLDLQPNHLNLHGHHFFVQTILAIHCRKDGCSPFSRCKPESPARCSLQPPAPVSGNSSGFRRNGSPAGLYFHSEPT